MPDSRVFYVYVLFRPNGTPCYVGKGKDDRWLRMRRRHNKHLSGIIKAAGGEIPSVKVRDGLSEHEAFDIEIALIAAIGREANGGPLVNLTDGGVWFDGLSSSARAQLRAIALERAFVTGQVKATEALARRAAKTEQAARNKAEWQKNQEKKERHRLDPIRTINRNLWRENRPHI